MASAPRWIIVDDTNVDIHYSGPWAVNLNAAETQGSFGNFGPAYQNTLHEASVDASFSYNFTGSKVTVYGANNPLNTSGVLDPQWQCFVDGIHINSTGPFQFQENNWQFCSQDPLDDGPHVLTVNATVKSQAFGFDYIIYVPSASVPLDDKQILIYNIDPQVQSAYDSGWQSTYSGTANMTNSTDSVFTFNFSGVSLSWYGMIPTDWSHIGTTSTYSVDNGPPVEFTIGGLNSPNSPTAYYQKLFQTDNTTQDNHQLVVQFQGSGQTVPLTLVYLIVQNGTSTPEPSSPSTNTSTPTNTLTPNTSTPINTLTPTNISKPTNVTSTPTSPGPALPSSFSGGKDNTGIIVGAVVGSLVLIALAILGTTCIVRRNKQEKNGPALEPYFHYSQQDQQPPIPARHNATPPSRGMFRQFIASSKGYPQAARLVETPVAYTSLSTSVFTSNMSRNEKGQRQAESPAAALLAQREASMSRTLMHQDSGLHLHGDMAESVNEVPPQYTVE